MNRKSILSGPAAVTAGLALTLALGGAAPAPALAETAAAEQSQQAATGTEATDTKAADTKAFTANGRGYDSFADAVNAAAGATDKTVTINKTVINESTDASLVVDKDNVTVTAAKDVVFSGTLRVTGTNVTVNGIHFKLDPATNKNAQNLILSGSKGAKVTGNTFVIAAGDPATGASHNKDWQPSSVWLERGAKDTVISKGNTFTLGQVVNNSAVGVNMVGNGNTPITGTKITDNTATSGPISGSGTSGSMMLVVGNGNTPAGSYGITDTTITGNTVKNGTGLAADKSKTYGIAVTATKNTVIDDNTIEGYAAVSNSVYPNQGPNDELKVTNNKLDAFFSVLMKDNYVTEGGATVKGNTFGENTKYRFNGGSVLVTDQNGKTYSSVAKAIEAGATTVTLLQNVTEDVAIAANQTVTLDLAGHTLTNKSGDTITNNGTLTVNDSSAKKTGVIDNVTHGKAALKNEEGATATLNGGTFKRSKETGTKDNTFYTILNHGDMTINDGTTVELLLSNGTAAGQSSLIDNGWYSGAPANGKNATLTVNGGTFNGGRYVKNDSYGDMTINGGTFTNGASNALFNCNNLTINGGTFDPADSASGIVLACKGKPGAENGQVTIAGGTFKMTGSQKVVAMPKPKDHPASDSDIKISGGTYEGAEPKAEQIVDGSGLVKNADGTFGVKKAELLFSSGVENQTVTYDVAKGGSVTKDDLLKLVTVSVEGYTVKVDTTDLDALNKAIAAKDTSKTFSFEFSATKNGETKASMTTTITYKLTDSEPTETPETKPADKKPADKKPADKKPADKGALPKTGDNQVAAAVAATVAGAAAVAGGVAVTRRRTQR